MGTIETNYNSCAQPEQVYEKIENALSLAADKLCRMNQLVDCKTESGAIQQILLEVEADARGGENYRLSALTRAVFLLLDQVNNSRRVQPDTFAYLVYAMKIIQKLASESRCPALIGFEIPDTPYSEAIGVIIDHTCELAAPQMQLR